MAGRIGNTRKKGDRLVDREESEIIAERGEHIIRSRTCGSRCAGGAGGSRRALCAGQSGDALRPGWPGRAGGAGGSRCALCAGQSGGALRPGWSGRARCAGRSSRSGWPGGSRRALGTLRPRCACGSGWPGGTCRPGHARYAARRACGPCCARRPCWPGGSRWSRGPRCAGRPGTEGKTGRRTGGRNRTRHRGSSFPRSSLFLILFRAAPLCDGNCVRRKSSRDGSSHKMGKRQREATLQRSGLCSFTGSLLRAFFRTVLRQPFVTRMAQPIGRYGGGGGGARFSSAGVTLPLARIFSRRQM